MAVTLVSLEGHIDELENVDTAFHLKEYLESLAVGCFVVLDVNLPAEAPGNLSPNQGNPFEHFGDLLKMYNPLGLEGTFTVSGLRVRTNQSCATRTTIRSQWF